MPTRQQLPVQAVFLNGRPVRSSEEARSLLMQQFSDPISDFRFEQACPKISVKVWISLWTTCWKTLLPARRPPLPVLAL
ncbi:hypothetical protein [Deinococcus radiophilus]|uniref:hypothetical protein n=1 Tax=Deinococcus radiophilus TaxID=32062 RepID=UPI0036215129